MVYHGFSMSNASRVIPGTVSLGLGNAFAELGAAGPLSFDFLTGAARFAMPDPGQFQVAWFDPNAINPFATGLRGVDLVRGATCDPRHRCSGAGAPLESGRCRSGMAGPAARAC